MARTFFDDEEFLDQLVKLLTQDAETLERLALLIEVEDFKPLRGMQWGQQRSVAMDRALAYYQRFHQPLGKLLRADILEYAQGLQLNERQIELLENYVDRLQGIKLNSADAIIEKVMAFKEQRLTAATIQELIDLQAAGQLPPQKMVELAQRCVIPRRPEDWPEPEPLEAALPEVVPFHENALPKSLRPLVVDVAERMQVPMDLPAVIAVLSLAGVVGRRATMRPKEKDTSWVVTPNLWGAIVAPPGFMKSPVIQAVTSPLRDIQTKWRMEREDALKNFMREKEKYDLRYAAWKEQYKASAKKGKAEPEMPTDEPVEPGKRRLIVNDTTFEALQQILSENPAGILLIRDELTGWWSRVDQADSGQERSFYLESWDGSQGYDVDRIVRGSNSAQNCLSVVGGIQPGRLRSYLADALHDGPSNDGLFQRFQLLVWPDTSSEWKNIDREPNAKAEERAKRVYDKLIELDPGKPLRFRWAADAQRAFTQWRARLEVRVRGEELHPALVSHLSKYRSLMPSLALLFELADRAAFGTKHLPNKANVVSLNHAKQAAWWCRYLESHARRTYSCVVTPQMKAAQALADKIMKHKLGTSFSGKDAYRPGWEGLKKPEEVKQAVEILLDAHWLRELPAEIRPLGGRPSTRYEINPKVWGKLGDEEGV
jgi:putative DNA primase/helicase